MADLNLNGGTQLDIGAAIHADAPSRTEGTGAEVAPFVPNRGLEDPREAARWARLQLRWFTAAGNGVDQSVTSGASTVAITFKRQEPNTSYGVAVVPSWSTTVYVATSDKSKTGFTAHFGTAAPASATCSWATFRSEDS